MSQLFDDSDVESDLKTTNEYAKSYDSWRKKEEFNKLKTKYGDASLTLDDGDESSSSEDDEYGVELTEDVEKDFYKTLALLKKKDPKIYDEKTVFFTDNPKNEKKSTKNKEESISVRDYERKLLLEKGGNLDEIEEEETKKLEEYNPTYVEEQKELKESLKKVAEGNDESDDEGWGGLFKKRQQNVDETEKQDADYKAWLAGQTKKLEDEETVHSLKPLKDYWNDPNLEDGEKFLKDYILNKRYLDNEDENYIPTYDEIVHDSDANLTEDEQEIEKQEEFEHKFNFRFEEPDEDYIKRYPRTIEHSLRKEDNKRKIKRQETKERKAKEKAQKMEELKKLRELKKKEIEEKIEKLKEITGNKEMAFDLEDIDGDFDPEAHDKKMQELFNEEYYEGPEDDQKPTFDMDDEDILELEPENFDNWTGTEGNNEPHCEDEDFIMDADYDPQASTQDELIENSKKRKKRRRKSKFVEMLAKEKPKFDPNDKTYQEYLDEYYKLDCEDIIDNIPCRFKYREVPPNSFGLTIEEILLAKDRELNKWCSLKKTYQIRPDHVEKYDQIAYEKRAKNLELKRKLLPSLFVSDDENEDEQTKNETKKRKLEEEPEQTSVNEETRKKRKKNRKAPQENQEPDIENETNKSKLNKGTMKNMETSEQLSQNNETENNPKKPKKNRKKNQKASNQVSEKDEANEKTEVNSPIINKKRNKRKKKTQKDSQISNTEQSSSKKRESENNETTKKFKGKKKPSSEIGISDARLQAYGLNPKKFKNKMKYSGKNNK